MYGVYEINIHVYNASNLTHTVGEGVKGVGTNICIIEQRGQAIPAVIICVEQLIVLVRLLNQTGKSTQNMKVKPVIQFAKNVGSEILSLLLLLNQFKKDGFISRDNNFPLCSIKWDGYKMCFWFHIVFQVNVVFFNKHIMLKISYEYETYTKLTCIPLYSLRYVN